MILALPRLIRIALATLLAFVVAASSRAIAKLKPARGLALRNWALRMWSKQLCKALRAKVTVTGTPPSGDFFLVANHLGYLDIPLISCAADTAFVAKADIESWPLLGKIFAAGDTIYIDRGRKKDLLRVMDQMDQRLGKGLGVLVFPEGTSSKGESILRFKPSLLQYAVARDKPVHWAVINYQTPEGELPPSEAVCWWGDEALAPHFKRLMKLSRIEAHVHFSDAPIRGNERKELAEALRSAMSERFRPMA